MVDKNQILVLTRSASVDTDSLDVPSLLESAAYALIAGGGFIFGVAFLGCCGAITKSKCMLIMVFVYVFISLQTMVKRVIKVHRDWTPLNTLVKKYEIEEVIFSFRVCVCACVHVLLVTCNCIVNKKKTWCCLRSL